MKRLRWLAPFVALALVAAACGGDDDGGGLDGDGTSDTTADGGPSDECEGVALEASEVGVTPTQVKITVMADTGSTLAPGLFQGSVDALQGWAEYKNANGGLACREVVVEDYDSKLSADEAKNGIVSACQNSLALVGTTSLFLNNMADAESCEDKAGAVTGVPDFAVLQTEPAQQCSPVSFAVIPATGSCPYTSGDRTFTERLGVYSYYFEQFGEDALHGVWVIPADLPATISASMPGFRASQEIGVGLDAEFGLSGLSEQAAYTPVVQAIKENQATYARVGLDYAGTLKLRKEAQQQGVDSVLVWDCSLQCYDQRLIEQGGSAVEDQFAWIFFLPFEEEGSNDTLDSFLEYVDEPDGFAAQAWAAAELFAKMVDQIVEADGPNGITRAKLLDAVKNEHEFDAGGMIAPTDIGGKRAAGCFVLMQIQNGEFVRVYPEEPGTFACDEPNATYEITLDPVKAFQG